jgi:hypothetical protein
VNKQEGIIINQETISSTMVLPPNDDRIGSFPPPPPPPAGEALDNDNDVIRDDDDEHEPMLTAASMSKKMEPLEIEIGIPESTSAAADDDDRDFTGAQTPETRSFDEDDDVFSDMENLLGKKKKKKGDPSNNNGANGNSKSAKNDSDDAAATTTNGQPQQQHVYCLPCLKIQPEMTMGNVQVPSLYVYGYTGGWGVIGPHWFGPPCVIALLIGSTYYIAHVMSYRKHWYWTAFCCYYLSVQTFYFLLSAAYRDAGIVRDGRLNVPNPVPRNFRWCEACQYHQPPTTLHCPDCNACVLGFDHHCVWMGNCIGVGTFSSSLCCCGSRQLNSCRSLSSLFPANFKPFMRFNLSWIFYLIYAILWVSIIAPILDRRHHP